jgi:hypothetical protein
MDRGHNFLVNSFPTDKETLQFVDRFCSEHSWYKHLGWEQPTMFIFYIHPQNGEWEYDCPELRQKANSFFLEEGEMEPDPLDFLNDDIKQLGKFGLTAFIHDYFKRSANEEYKQKHQELKNSLISFLLELKNKIKFNKD